MNIGLLNIMHTKMWDFRPDLAQSYADALKNAIELHIPNDVEKKEGFFLSKRGYQKDGQTRAANFEDKLYFGNIYRIERHLYWNDEELQEDDQIINVVVVDGPVTRDGDGCSYGTKDFRDQVMYANTIPQVIGHIFIINTPGGQATCRNDYEMMIEDCRKNGKPTVAFIDGMCCSSGVNLACRCDRTVVMNPRDEFGCIGTMAAFWAVAHDTVDQDGYRYVELVGKDCPDKNDWYREAAAGEYEKLQAELDRDTTEFHSTVRENRPLVTGDMLTGKVFEAQEVIPQLVDEIGNMERAIECVFELADEKLTAARLVTAEPKEDEPGSEPAGEPEEIAKLNDQQKAAVSANKGGTVIVDDGHVRQVREGLFGEYEEEIAKPQNENNMNEEVLKDQEAQVAQAAEPAQEPAAEPAQEPAAEPAQEPAAEPAGEGTQEPAAEPAEEPAAEPAAEPAQEPASEEAVQTVEEDIDKIRETLHNAEQLVEQRDEEIAGLKEKVAAMEGITAERDDAKEEFRKKCEEFDRLSSQLCEKDNTIAARDKSIEEKDALIESLKKQLGDLKAEVKELAGKPAPMVDAAAGVPQDNGTGDAPKQKKRITRDMTYEEIRAVKKAAAEKAGKEGR